MEPVRFHTAGRKQPILLGKDSSGNKLPGGPYSVPQLVAVLATAVLLIATRQIWAAGQSGLAFAIITVVLCCLAGFAVGRHDFAGRNPFVIGLGVGRAWSGGVGAPEGHVGTRSLKRTDRKPLSRRRWVMHTAIGQTMPEEAATPQPSPAPPQPVSPHPAETNQHLISTPPRVPNPLPVSTADQPLNHTATSSSLEQFLAAAERTHHAPRDH